MTKNQKKGAIAIGGVIVFAVVSIFTRATGPAGIALIALYSAIMAAAGYAYRVYEEK